jgi:hypothetical protein
MLIGVILEIKENQHQQQQHQQVVLVVASYGVSGATTTGMRAPSPTIGGVMGGVGGSGPPETATTAKITTYVSGVAIDGNLTISTAATGRANVMLCRFPQDSTMVEYIDQQKMDKLEHVVTMELEVFKDIHTVRSDAFTIKARPLKTLLRMLKCFLLYFKRYNRSYYGNCTEGDVLTFAKGLFDAYCRNAAAGTLETAGLKAPPGSGGGRVNVGTAVVAGAGGPITAQEFRHDVKRDKAHYEDLKDDK